MKTLFDKLFNKPNQIWVLLNILAIMLFSATLSWGSWWLLAEFSVIAWCAYDILSVVSNENR